MVDPNAVNWNQAAATFVPVFVAIGAALHTQYLARKKELKRLETTREREHKENQEKLELIIAERRFLVPHYHQETISENPSVVLRVGGIIRAKSSESD